MPFSATAEAAAWRALRMRRGYSAHSVRHLGRLEAQGAPGSGQPRGVGLAQVGQGELFEAHRVGLPAWGDWTGPCVNPDEHVGLRFATLGVNEVQAIRIRVHFNGRTGQHAMTGEQVVDHARHLYAPVRYEYEVVSDPLE